jgi:aryl-alcohol dehydrogenase-like predicted oxidoreductase
MKKAGKPADRIHQAITNREPFVAANSYVTLGRSGLRVSPFTLGTMTFGDDAGWGSSPAESASILAAYLDRGGNSIDTANIYTGGHSEKIIGDWFAAHPERRDRVVLGTTFFGNLYPGDPNGGGAGRKGIVQQLENSLRRLRTDYVDLYWLHNFDPATPVEETLRALDDLVTAGKIRYAGLSDMPAWKVAESAVITRFRGWAPVTALQLEYSLLERTSEAELIPAAVALAWVQGQPGITSVIIGARRAGQLEANLGALDLTLTEDQRRRLDEVSAPALGFPAVVNRFAGRLAFSGATVDGRTWDVHPALAAATTRY